MTTRIAASAIAFDLDGTLLDTVDDLAAAANAMLAERGLAAVPTETVCTMVGKGMANLVRQVLSVAHGAPPASFDEATIEAALARYHAHYEKLLGSGTRPYPGLTQALDQLRAMGFPLAIVTNKASKFVLPHLEQAGIAHHFDLLVGGDSLPTRKPDAGPLLHVASVFAVPPARLLMVGDSINDVAAARAAGCPVLVLPHGYNEGEPVQNLDADGIVQSLDAVADHVRFISSDAP